MIKPKQKQCKGTTPETKGFGCGVLTFHHLYGLGKMCGCLSKWYQETEAGRLKVLKSIPQAKKKVESENKKKAVKEKKELKEKIKTLTEWQKELEKEINRICCLIDKGNGCISCKGTTTPQAGHYHTVKSNGSIRFNLDNLHLQDHNCNCKRSGNIQNYDLGLIEIYGREYWEYVKFDIIAKYPILKLHRFEYQDLIYKARSIVKYLKLQDKKYNALERLELRKRFNIEIGIYL